MLLSISRPRPQRARGKKQSLAEPQSFSFENKEFNHEQLNNDAAACTDGGNFIFHISRIGSDREHRRNHLLRTLIQRRCISPGWA